MNRGGIGSAEEAINVRWTGVGDIEAAHDRLADGAMERQVLSREDARSVAEQHRVAAYGHPCKEQGSKR